VAVIPHGGPALTITKEDSGKLADTLATVIDAQRAEQRNAESRLSWLWEKREVLIARGSEEARARLDMLDRDIAAAAARVKRALRLQAETMMEMVRSDQASVRN
jgi:hypothetical protein